MMRRGIVVALATLALLSACGSDRPPPAGDGFGQGASSSGGTAPKPPGCGVDERNKYCDCVDVPLVADPPNIYFVLDRSGSMAHRGKWSAVQEAVGDLTRGLGARASFGVTIFPGTTTENCGPGIEVMSVRLGDPVGSTTDGPTTKTLLAAIAVAPTGGTPTTPTLRYVLERVKTLKGRTVVVLATDGAPNCNPDARCGPELCTDNIANVQGCPTGGPTNCCLPPKADQCFDAPLSVAAVKDLATAGFPTYVIGISTTALEATLLDDLAVAGGTANPTSPKYVRADDESTTGLLAVLRKVAGKVAGACKQQLKAPPEDPTRVNVYLDEVVLPQDPANGWTIEGATVTLTGAACARVENGDVLDVRIIAGCPTVKLR